VRVRARAVAVLIACRVCLLLPQHLALRSCPQEAGGAQRERQGAGLPHVSDAPSARASFCRGPCVKLAGRSLWAAAGLRLRRGIRPRPPPPRSPCRVGPDAPEIMQVRACPPGLVLGQPPHTSMHAHDAHMLSPTALRALRWRSSAAPPRRSSTRR
jgi:hypothetical protein